MSNPRRRSQSPMMRRTGGIGETGSAAKTRISCDSPSSMSWYDGRDDVESGREEVRSASDLPDEKAKKFDALLRRIEAEREKIATAESTPPSRQATNRRSDRANVSSAISLSAAPSSVSYDFASRARELRMSVDGVPSRSGTPKRLSERDNSKEKHFTQLARDMTPSSVGRKASPPIKSRMSYDGTQSYTPTPKRSESPSMRHEFSHGARDTPPRSAGNTPVRSSSPMRPPPPNPSQVDFKQQVEKFHSSLVSAHDTITTLEKDVRHLNKRVGDKDECIFSLEHRNKSLNDSLAKMRGEVSKIEDEKNTLLAGKTASSKRHSEELAKLQIECDGYKKQVGEIEKLSDSKAKEVERDKQKAERSIQDKDNMIANLRNEIQRLNEELADGSFVRSQALKAEETAKKLEAELDKSREDQASATKVIVDLEVRLKEKSDEFDQKLKGKDKEMATLQSEILGDVSMKQSSELLKEKIGRLKSELADSKLQNEELTDKAKDLERRLESAERIEKKKDEELQRLESAALDSESLKRQLEKEHRKFERQREILEKYETGCATEQETVAALEQAIEDLETAHNESNDEILRLQEENRSLSATLAEAEEYMKMYQKDMKDARKIKSIVGEIQDMNSDLSQQVQKKDERISSLHERIVSLETEVESSSASSKQKILQLENMLSRKKGDFFKLQEELASNRDSQDREERNTKKLTKMSLELEQLKTDRSRMLRNEEELTNQANHYQNRILELERELDLTKKKATSGRDLVNKLDKDQVKKSQHEAKRAWARVGELEDSVEILQNKLSEAEQRPDDGSQIEELKMELSMLKEKLAERNEQLTDSRMGIAEAQKMIFRLMNTVQDLRKGERA